MSVSTPPWIGQATLALASLLVASALAIAPAAAEKPVAGKQIHFSEGIWSALPQLGPDGKVRQCVLVAPRQRAGKDGPINTAFSLNISHGSGFSFVIQDKGLPMEEVLDDQAEIVIDGRNFPAVGFPVAGIAFTLHPGDAEGALSALGSAKRVTLRSDGAGLDSGAVDINLPSEALNWLKQCGKIFDIAIDKPTDPNAPEMPAPRPRSPKISIVQATSAGPPGTEDKQKIEGWNASELRNNDGTIQVCYIRRQYTIGSEPNARQLGTFLMVSRRRGLTLMLKDTHLDQPENKPVEASLRIGNVPFTDFSAHVLGRDEIGIFPQHGAALAAALEGGALATFKGNVGDQMEFPVQTSVIPWLRACARRNGIAIEPVGP